MLFSAGKISLSTIYLTRKTQRISTGISLSFSLIRRIDALMLLTKELVGEAYRVRNLPKDAVEGRYTLHV